MRFFLLGLFIGLIVGLIPFWTHRNGFELYPEWHGKIDTIGAIEPSNNTAIAPLRLQPIKVENRIFILAGNGELKHEVAPDDLTAVSGNGKYYITYQKVGTSIEFFNIQGDRFWKLKSLEYPYLSYHGKLILLLNGDHSRIRIVDFNSNEIGVRHLHGRFCTTIAFSCHSDFAGIGFLDGSYYVIDENGLIRTAGTAPHHKPVKGISLSSRGNFAAIHHGGKENDIITLVNIPEKRSAPVELNNVHLTRTTMHITESGLLTAIDRDRILIADEDGDIQRIIRIPEKRVGHSRIEYRKGLLLVSYTKKTGEAFFLIFRSDGRILLAKEFPEEPMLDCSITDSVILLRGSQYLYCYSFSY
jgi:hypothetical protein